MQPVALQSKFPTYPLKDALADPYIMMTADEAKMCMEALKDFAPNVHWMVKGLSVEALRAKLDKQIKDNKNGTSTKS